MRHTIMVTVMLLLTGGLLTARAQSGSVAWWVLGGGFGVAVSGNTGLTSTVGEALAGSSSAGETGIRSGFLAGLVAPGVSTDIPGISEEGLPTVYALGQNYPNPFNPTTVVSSQYPVSGHVNLTVYDLLGREVAVLVDEWRGAGRYQDAFNASRLASGVYVYRLTAGSFAAVKKMILMK